MGGLATTFELLADTENEAAVRVLLPALDSSSPAIQEGALIAILKRRNPAGGREILNRMPRMKPEWKAIIRQHQGRMTGTLREAILGTDPELCENGCRATVLFREYDLIPTLLNVLEDSSRPNAAMAARTVLELVASLYDELSAAHSPGDHHDPQMVRRYILGSLEHSVQRFGQHKRREVIESFLLLVKHDNVTLNQILQNPHHVAFLTVMDSLSKSTQRGVMRLLLNCLDDPHVPSAALTVIANRRDARFVHHLLKKIGREPSATVAQNLKRVESISWFADLTKLLDQIDDAGQHAIVRLAITAAIPRQQAFAAIECTLLHGKPGGRREAARMLAEFRGADANALAMQALPDPDPQVQAFIVAQLRSRGIPGILPSLLELVESPYEAVRKAARESLAEFSFKRYVGAFDMLEEDVRRSTGLLVKKIDPHCSTLLKEELKSPVRTRRLRGLAIARLIGIVDALEGTIIELLQDEDHIVRVEAAAALAQSSTPASIAALKQALTDSSEVVRQTAGRTLLALANVPLPASLQNGE